SSIRDVILLLHISVNDFKSIEGDTKLGLQSIPVIFGIDTAKWICIGAINLTQTTIA
ncbi:Chlorophyll synthase protein, partial [Thalictrum thalictroides]